MLTDEYVNGSGDKILALEVFIHAPDALEALLKAKEKHQIPGKAIVIHCSTDNIFGDRWFVKLIVRLPVEKQEKEDGHSTS